MTGKNTVRTYGTVKRLFNGIIYVSCLAALYYLYRFDYLSLKGIRFRYGMLVVSILVLWGSRLMLMLCWWKNLNVHGLAVDKKDAFVSFGMPVFAKYVPGKVLTVLSRAAYISIQGFSFKNVSFVSFRHQVMYIWTGLVLTVFPIMLFPGMKTVKTAAVAGIVIFTLFIFSKTVHETLNGVFRKITHRELGIPYIPYRETGGLSVWFFLFWILWTAGYFFFLHAVHPSVSPLAAFAMPVSAVMGFLAFFAPAGLGVREGIMSGFLVMNGFPLKTATTVSVMARLWIVCADVFMFVIALVLNKGLRCYKKAHDAGTIKY